ncbi:unnamed protein product [Schistosoma margrebowiei]|uniref:Uncharacterized protein n=1 Tax=Schistosoma margrebowiei TaxID=48269 RepID=A0A183LR97_9TREM|nr:unnamed protein product [Schistosoma margrebowiei]
MGKNKPDPSGGRNQEEALEVDRTHIEESTQLRHKASPHLQSSRPKEKRNTKVHIAPRNGNRHEKNEQQLVGTRKEGSGQNVLENAKGNYINNNNSNDSSGNDNNSNNNISNDNNNSNNDNNNNEHHESSQGFMYLGFFLKILVKFYQSNTDLRTNSSILNSAESIQKPVFRFCRLFHQNRQEIVYKHD